MRRVVLAVIVLTLCFVPPASALDKSQGSWGETEGDSASFVQVAAHGSLSAAYQSPLAPGVSFSFRAPLVEVSIFQDDRARGEALDVQTGGLQERSYVLHDVHGSLRQPHDGGFIGLGLDGATTSWNATSLHVKDDTNAAIGSRHVAKGNDTPGLDYFFRESLQPTLHGNLSGALSSRGEIDAKIFGAQVLLEARENSTLVDTGKEIGIDSGATPQVQTYRDTWMVLTLHEASLQLTSDPGVEFLSNEARLHWTGEFRAPAAPMGEHTWDVTLKPGSHGLDTQFSSSDDATQSAIVVPAAGPAALPILLVGLAAAGGGTLLVAARLRRRLPRNVRVRMSAAACMEEAHVAERVRDPLRALAWARRAAEAAPEDQGILLELAWHLDNAGRPSEAKETYERALRLGSPDGGCAHMEFAIFLAKRFRDAKRAEALAIEALRRDPGLLGELFMEESALEVLSGRPLFEEAVREAERAEPDGL